MFKGLLLLIFILPLSSCGQGVTEKRVEETAVKADHLLRSIYSNALQVASLTENLVSNRGRYNLDISLMEIGKGGKYRTFENLIYHKASNDGGAQFYVTGAVPVNDDIRKLVKLMENGESTLISNLPPACVNFILFRDNLLAISYPWIDFLSVLTPRLNYLVFPWYFQADAAHNPAREPVWSPAPFLTFRGEWVLDVMVPVYVSNRMEAVICNEVHFASLARLLLDEQDKAIILVTESGAVLGASLPARKAPGIEPILPMIIMRQMKENRFLQDSLTLGWVSNSPGLRALGAMLPVSNRFSTELNGAKYRVFTKRLSVRTNLILAALEKE